MHDYDDVWYVLLPTGQVVQINGTQNVRDNLRDGRLPPNCQVRRAPDDDWRDMDGVVDFADLVHRRYGSPATAQRRPPRSRAKTKAIPREAGKLRRRPPVSVLVMAQDLVKAFDRTLVPARLGVGMFAGFIVGLIVAIIHSGWLSLWVAEIWVPWTVVGSVIVIVVAVLSVLLTQGLYVELSKLRPAGWEESSANLGRLSFRAATMFVMVWGCLLLAMVGLHVLIGWVGSLPEGPGDLLAVVAGGLQMTLWPLMIMALLLPTVLVIEEGGIFRTLGHWLELLRHHGGRVFVFQAMAMGLGLLMTGVLSWPLIMVAAGGLGGERFAAIMQFAAIVMLGVVGGGLFAYVIVANVLIYVNLRYAMGERADND